MKKILSAVAGMICLAGMMMPLTAEEEVSDSLAKRTIGKDLPAVEGEAIETEEYVSPIGAKHVVIVGFDGMGAKFLNWDEMPVMSRLRDNGAWTEDCMSILPSDSIPNWTANLMGASPNITGYRQNLNINGGLLLEPESPAPNVLSEKGKFPCLFRQLRRYIPDAGTSFCSWTGLANYVETSDIDEVFESNNIEEQFNFFFGTLKKNPTLAMIVFSEPDEVGHIKGWGSEEYHKTSQVLDGYLGKIVDYLEENGRFDDTVLIIASDHGGVNFSRSVHYHGDRVYEDLCTPRIYYGCGVKPGHIDDVVMGFDLAPTVQWIFGLPQAQMWRGKPNFAAFGIEAEQVWTMEKDQ